MTTQFGVLLPTREAVMSNRPETGPLLAMAERAEAAGFDFASGRDGPMKKRVEAGDAFAIGERLDVFEEGGETANDPAAVEVFGDLVKGFERDLGFGGSGRPDVLDEFFGFKFAFDGHEDTPFEFVELNDIDVHDFSEAFGTAARFHAFATDMADAKSEEAFGRHDAVVIGADFVAEEITMARH